MEWEALEAREGACLFKPIDCMEHDPGHWVWMPDPDKDMLLSSYIDELRLSNAQFVKVTP